VISSSAWARAAFGVVKLVAAGHAGLDDQLAALIAELATTLLDTTDAGPISAAKAIVS
jgi:hypothetical protein